MSVLSWEQVLLCKYPPFNNDWSDADKLAWFDGFKKLCEITPYPDPPANPPPGQYEDMGSTAPGETDGH